MCPFGARARWQTSIESGPSALDDCLTSDKGFKKIVSVFAGGTAPDDLMYLRVCLLKSPRYSHRTKGAR
ncbi:hypothetical protein EVAR_62289_1 [Eumeta japonica]|uniref:Uncharacterized protein n=1 Tax=Eumeta variegata TaxID=151549 RepID=A0A4C1ZWR2_EUMVA|nr:hypothetical protein EVAR_62289_1 [Eumeta japonica]